MMRFAEYLVTHLLGGGSACDHRDGSSVSSLGLFWGVAIVMCPLAPDLPGGSEST